MCVRSVSSVCVCVCGGGGGEQNLRVFVWKGVNLEKHGLYTSSVCVLNIYVIELNWPRHTVGGNTFPEGSRL